jgi:Ca-activated chloride channel family protein
MMFRDQPQDRLSAVKRVAGEFLENRVGDRVGLILFGTRAYLQVPLTLDRQTVNDLLQESAIGIAGEKTAIGDAIGLTLKRLKDRPGEDKVLVLLTDGSNTAGTIAPLKAAELAATAGLKIHTIGVGAEQMLIQDMFGSRLVNPSSDLDEKTLTAIAQLTGGKYFRAQDATTLSKVYNLINQLELVEEDSQHLRPTIELFHWPLSLAVILALLLILTTGLTLTTGLALTAGQLKDVITTRISSHASIDSLESAGKGNPD